MLFKSKIFFILSISILIFRIHEIYSSEDENNNRFAEILDKVNRSHKLDLDDEIKSLLKKFTQEDKELLIIYANKDKRNVKTITYLLDQLGMDLTSKSYLLDYENCLLEFACHKREKIKLSAQLIIKLFQKRSKDINNLLCNLTEFPTTNIALIIDHIVPDYLNMKTCLYQKFPLDIAVSQGFYYLARTLLQSGAKLTAQAVTADSDILRELILSDKKYLNTKMALSYDAYSLVPIIFVAIAADNIDLIQKIIGKVDLSIRGRTRMGEFDALSYAIKYRDVWSERKEIIKLLIDSKADVNAVYNDKIETNLHYAIFYGDLKALELLLSAPNIDINKVAKVSGKLQTPLQMAQSNNCDEFVRLLISKGAR